MYTRTGVVPQRHSIEGYTAGALKGYTFAGRNLVMKRTPLTIKDIARLAGVSHATVSRVLNGRANVKESTRRTILSLVDQLNFSPNPSARALISGRRYTIGLLILYDLFQRQFPAEFLPALLAGMTTELNRRGYHLALYFDQLQHESNQVRPEMISSKQLDGLFVLTLERQAATAHKRTFS